MLKLEDRIEKGKLFLEKNKEKLLQYSREIKTNWYNYFVKRTEIRQYFD